MATPARILHAPAKRFANFRDPWLASLLDRMQRAMVAHGGIGLAAPQISVSRRIAIAQLSIGFFELVNPEIAGAGGEEADLEGCLSLKDEVWMVTRPTSMRVRYQDRAGTSRKLSVSGHDARILAHELDHLRGRLISDIGHRVTEFELVDVPAAAAPGLGSESAAAATSSIGGDLRLESAAERARPERGSSASTFAAEDGDRRG